MLLQAEPHISPQEPNPCDMRECLMKTWQTAMAAWGTAHQCISHAWDAGTVDGEMQETLDRSLELREGARAEYWQHRREHGC
jgi:hypothetical protein